MSRRRAAAALLSLLLSTILAACGSSGTTPSSPSVSTSSEPGVASTEPIRDPAAIDHYRTDLTTSGNRIAPGTGTLTSALPVDIDLPFVAEWVLGADVGGGLVWVAVSGDGSAVRIDPDGTISPIPGLDAGRQPRLQSAADGTLQLTPAASSTSSLPDAVTVSHDDVLAELDDPTDRYPHGALADDLEAAAIRITRTDGDTVNTTTVTLTDTVVEGLSPMLADVTGDGTVEVIVTEANSRLGGQVVVYGLDGEQVASTRPIGQGNRWRHQIAVAPIGPAGEVELIEVVTPHIGGIVQFHRFDGQSLEVVASTREYTSHVYDTINLDLAVVADATGDNRLELIIPTQDRTQLAILRRTNDGVEEVARADIGATLSSNLAAVTAADGALVFAIATNDGNLRIWN